MSNRNFYDSSNLSIIDAVETLSSIADLELDREVGVAEANSLIAQENTLAHKTTHWLYKQNADMTLRLVKEIYKVILSYLRNFYKKEYRNVANEHAIEGVKTIMVLVGEAAKKLDKVTALFQNTAMKSVKELPEYRKLQDFYLSRIARKIDEGTLGKWILALTQKTIEEQPVELVGTKSVETKHVFVDLESVKKDTEYELFFLRKEDSSRYFSPLLIRNIKLICDFGSSFGLRKSDDPLASVQLWVDRNFHYSAKGIWDSLGQLRYRYFREAARHKDHELVVTLNKALMALMMCCNSQNLLRNNPIKSCSEYFYDFQMFLREAMQTRDYEKLITYPPKKTDHLSNCLVETIHGLCRGLFLHLQGQQELIPIIQGLIQEADQERSPEHLKASEAVHTIWSKLACDYAAMMKLMRHHTNGPLVKVIDVLQNGDYNSFDPLIQENVPNQLFSLFNQETKIVNIRIPSPTRQEFIHRVIIDDEFKGFLRSCLENHSKHLLINLQDKTSWREHFRSAAIEELTSCSDFSKCLEVVTLAKDTEFYHQLPPYNQENHADVFIKHLKNQIKEDDSGFFFPKHIKKALFPQFTDGVIEHIHRIFFSGKNVLTRENRLDFIEIFYLFLELKLIELIKPDSFSLTCKDGIDTGGAASAFLFIFLKILTEDKFTDVEIEHLNQMLYIPALLNRERVMLPERFNRMISALKALESTKAEFGLNFAKIVNEAFGRYFKTPILHALVVLPPSQPEADRLAA